MRRYLLPLLVSGVVVGLLPAITTASASPGRPIAAHTAASAVVRLPTGDSVRIGSVAGRQQVSVVAAQRAGITGHFQTVRLGQDSYVFPAEAQPFLGRLLDPSLFDVSALARLEHAGRIPVTIDTANGAHVRVPGLVVTSRSNRITNGFLTQHGADALRSALTAASRRTLRPGGSLPASLFGGVHHLAVTGVVAPPTPKFQMYTLKIKVLDATGAPAAGGTVFVINTDDARRYIGAAYYRNGGARISVPEGHYSAVADLATFGRHGLTERIVPIADFTVTGSNETIMFDARTATRRVAVHTPRPATAESMTAEFDREASGVGGLSVLFGFFGGPEDLRIAPTSRARVGQMQWLTTWSLTGTAKKARPYAYDLSFLDDGRVSADQSRTVAAFQLATVNSRYYTDRRRGTSSAFARVPFYPWQFVVFASLTEIHTPVARTEYIYGDPSAVWLDTFVAVSTPRHPFGSFMEDGPRRYLPGEQRSADWMRGPLVPGAPAQTNGDDGFFCVACRTVHTMTIALYPATDTTPGHIGFVNSTRGAHFALYRGSKLIGHRDGAFVTVPALTGRYRVHMTTKRARDGARTSTATTTDLTFDSSAGSGAPLPDRWRCAIRPPTVCTVLPLLHAHVPLPTTMTDQLPVGASSFVLTIAPIQGAKHARITAAGFETRLPGGRFRPAAMQRLGNGRYRVTLANPRSAIGKAVSIRVFGRDAAGDSITQTTRAAYFVGRR